MYNKKHIYNKGLGSGTGLTYREMAIQSGYYVPKNLNEKHRIFLEEYFRTGDRLEAMRAAGYTSSKENLYRMSKGILFHPEAKKFMVEMNKRALDELFLDKSKLILKLYKFLEKIENKNSSMATIKGYELLAKLLKLLDPEGRVQLEVNTNSPIVINYIQPGSSTGSTPTQLDDDDYSFRDFEDLE